MIETSVHGKLAIAIETTKEFEPRLFGDGSKNQAYTDMVRRAIEVIDVAEGIVKEEAEALNG